MNYNGNDPIPEGLKTVMVDGTTKALLDGYICKGTMASLIDPKAGYRYCVDAKRVK